MRLHYHLIVSSLLLYRFLVVVAFEGACAFTLALALSTTCATQKSLGP